MWLPEVGTVLLKSTAVPVLAWKKYRRYRYQYYFLKYRGTGTFWWFILIFLKIFEEP